MFVFRMKLLVVCLLVILPTIDGFIGEFVEYVEDLPFRVMPGTCYFRSKRYYRPGQLEIKVIIDKPTVDLHVSIGEIYSKCKQQTFGICTSYLLYDLLFVIIYFQIVITYCCFTLIIIRCVLYLFLTFSTIH